MTDYLVDPIIAQQLDQTSTIPEQALGTIFQGAVARYIYVQANGAVAQYDFVKVDDDYQVASATTTLLPSTEPGKVGCAQIAFADNDYGWVAIQGQFTGNFAASCAQDVKIYTTATGGVVDDSSTTEIVGLKLITTITTAASSPAYAAIEMFTA